MVSLDLYIATYRDVIKTRCGLDYHPDYPENKILSSVTNMSVVQDNNINVISSADLDLEHLVPLASYNREIEFLNIGLSNLGSAKYTKINVLYTETRLGKFLNDLIRIIRLMRTQSYKKDFCREIGISTIDDITNINNIKLAAYIEYIGSQLHLFANCEFRNPSVEAHKRIYKNCLPYFVLSDIELVFKNYKPHHSHEQITDLTKIGNKIAWDTFSYARQQSWDISAGLIKNHLNNNLDRYLAVLARESEFKNLKFKK